jgi:hypothetical protein
MNFTYLNRQYVGRIAATSSSVMGVSGRKNGSGADERANMWKGEVTRMRRQPHLQFYLMKFLIM